MLPERFGGIVFRRALGQYMRVPPAAMLPEPIGHLRVTVVGGAIVDVVQRTRVVGTSYLFEKPQVSFRVEDRLVVKQETCRIDLDATKDLHTLALPGVGHTGRASTPSPSLVQRRVLAKTRLIFKHQSRPAAARRFDACINVLPPAGLLDRVGANQQTFGALDRKSEIVQESADVTGMIADAK